MQRNGFKHIGDFLTSLRVNGGLSRDDVANRMIDLGEPSSVKERSFLYHLEGCGLTCYRKLPDNGTPRIRNYLRALNLSPDQVLALRTSQLPGSSGIKEALEDYRPYTEH